VLGLGEAGGRLAADLGAAGVEVHGYDPAVTPHLVPQAAVAGCAVVLSVNSASVAVAVCESVRDSLEEGVVFADLNTSAPALKRELAGLLAGRARFADVALLGPVPARGLATPALASGPGAAAFAALFVPFGMPVEVVSELPGDAARRKLLRSVFMKGIAAAALESLQAAGVSGEADWLDGELAEVLGRPLLDRLVEGSRRHAVRRVEEMEAATELLRELGVEPRIAGAAAGVLAELAERRRGVRHSPTRGQR
jgi:3-hydroxyisobutyrate dehydrogenase-like beta-hydroxyacid dehydrogenase